MVGNVQRNEMNRINSKTSATQRFKTGSDED